MIVRGWLKRIAIGVGGVLGVLLLAVLGLWGFANTGTGRAWIAEQVETALSDGDARAAITGLSGPLPQRIALERLTLSDGQGTWLTLETAEVAWNPLALLQGRLDVTRITAERVAVARPPEGPADTQPAPASGTGQLTLPKPPVSVRVREIRVERIELGEPLLGEAAALRLAGRLGAPTAGTLTTELDVTRLDGPGGAVTLDAGYDPAARTLDVRLNVDGKAGGLLAGPLDLPREAAVTANLTGSGPIADWQGKLTARLGTDARADLRLAVTDTRALAVTGRIVPGGLVPAPGPEFLGGPIQVALDLTRDAAWQRFGVADGRIRTPTAELTLSGTYDGGAGTIAARADLSVTDPAPVNARIAPASAKGLRLGASVEGPVLAPSMDATLTADRVTAPDAAIEGARLTAALRPDTDDGRRFDVDAGLEASRITLADPRFKGLSGAPLQLDAHGRIDPATQRLTNLRADVELGPTRLALRGGSADAAAGRGEGRYTVSLGELSALEPIVNMGLAGQGTLQGNLTVAADGDPMLDATVAGAFSNVRWQKQDVLDTLAGGVLQLDTRATVAGDGAIRLADIVLSSGTARIAGNVAVPGDLASVDGQVRAAIRDLSVLGNALNLPMAGRADVTATVTGPTSNPALEAELTAADLVLAGTGLGTLTVQADVRDLATGVNGTVRAKATASPAGPVELDGQIAMGDGAVRVRDATARVPGLDVTGVRLDVPLGGGAMTGKADLASADLGELEPLAGHDVAGSLDGTLSLAGTEKGQGLTADIAIADLVAGGGPRMARARLRAELDTVFDAPTGTVTADLGTLNAGGVTLEQTTLRATGGLDDAEVTVSSEGRFFGPLALDAKAALTREGATRRVRLTRLDARIQDRTLGLAQPATLEQGPDGLSVRDLALNADGGALRLELTKTAEQIDAALTLDTLPVGLVNLLLAEPKLAGALNGRVTVNGPLSAPRAEWTLSGAELTAKETDLPPLRLNVTGELADGHLTTDGRIEGLSESPVTLSAALPMTASLEPFAVAPRPAGEVSAKVAWAGDLAPIVPLIPVSGHRLGGTGRIDLRVDGTWADPKPTGTVELRDAVYENLDVGTLLTDISATIAADGERIRVQSFKAKDGGDGRVTVSGDIDLSGEDGPRLDLALGSRNAALVRRDEITAFADSDIAVTGTLADMAVNGDITVVRAEARVPDTLPPEVADLNVTEVGGDSGNAEAPPMRSGAVEAGTGKADTAGENRIALAIDVAIPNRMFLRGRGLDTEWRGDLKVRGTAASPIITGNLSAVRGRIDALSKTFQLKSGRVSFNGGEINPIIDTTAVHTSADLRVTVNVTGPASEPSFSLSAQPDMPQDEILSRLLFGKEVTNLSAGQAAQLAAAVAEFSGATGSGPGMLEKLRRGLGVDVLQFGGGSGTSVRAGQYLTEDVFVGVEQGLTQDSGKVTVEVGITDNIAVESNVGATGNSDVGLQFKWDY